MKIRTKLTLGVVVCAIGPLAISSFIGYRAGSRGMAAISARSDSAIFESVQNQLDSIGEIKTRQVEAVAAGWESDLTMLVESVQIQFDLGTSHLQSVADYKKKALESLFAQFMADLVAQQDRSICTKAMANYEQFLSTGERSEELDRYRSIVEGFVRNTHYLDFYIFNIDGVCVHSASQGPEFGRNMLEGDLGQTNLARGVRRALAGETVLVDFEPYAPKGNGYAAFAVAPINYSGTRTGAVALELPVEPINQIVLDRTGLGPSQESFVVGRLESDATPRLRSARASVKGAGPGTVTDSPAVREALAGKSGSLITTDATGRPSIEAFAPLRAAGLTWGMITRSTLNEVVAHGSADSGEKDLLGEFARRNGYPNLYLITPQGHVFFAANQGAAFETNVLSGTLRGSSLSALVQRVLSNRTFAMADFAHFPPAGMEHVAFVASPVLDGTETRFVVALEVDGAGIDAITGLRAGMGKSGCSYLIGLNPQGATEFRSDLTMMDPKYVLGSPITTPYIAEGMTTGKTTGGGRYVDSHGNEVIVSWMPVNVHGHQWGLFGKINGKEALVAVDEMYAVTDDALASFVNWSAGTAMAAVCIVAVFGIALGRMMVRPINLMAGRLQEIATGDGDLTQRVNLARSDEIGLLARWFDEFVGNIHQIISDVRANTDRVAAAATEVAASAEEMSASVDQQAQQIDSVQSAVDEVSGSVAAVAVKCGEAVTESKQAGEQAVKGGEIMDRTLDEMKKIAAQVNLSSDAVSKLGEKSEEIGAIIQVINDIADQTNLLALNAAIEAARAGEHGRGFAVVADEVRKLAERTQEATQQVGTTIGEIQSETKTAVERMGESRGRVDEGVKLATSAGSTLKEIVSSARTVADEIREISVVADSQSHTTETLARTLTEIRAVTDQATSGAHQAATAASELSASAEDLRALVQRFRI